MSVAGALPVFVVTVLVAVMLGRIGRAALKQETKNAQEETVRLTRQTVELTQRIEKMSLERKQQDASLSGYAHERDALTTRLSDATRSNAKLEQSIRENEQKIAVLTRDKASLDKQFAEGQRVKAGLEELLNTGRAATVELEATLRAAKDSEEAARRDLSLLISAWGDTDSALVACDTDGNVIALEGAGTRHGIELHVPFYQHLIADDRPFAQRQDASSTNGVSLFGARRAIDRRHLIVRSITLQQSISALKTCEGGRLLFVTPISKPDTELLELEERVKLGSLITHGIATQAALVWKHADFIDEWRQELMELLYRRVGVISKLLARWGDQAAVGANPTLPVRLPRICDLLNALSWLGKFVAGRPEVRRELEWQNGILSGALGSSPIGYTINNWPDVVLLTALPEHGELFIIEELIVNAFKHGVPGKPVKFEVKSGDGAEWAEIIVTNAVSTGGPTKPAKTYGGTNLIAEACRQGGWHVDGPNIRSGTYEVKLRVPCKPI
jgi:hypothetical protein